MPTKRESICLIKVMFLDTHMKQSPEIKLTKDLLNTSLAQPCVKIRLIAAAG